MNGDAESRPGDHRCVIAAIAGGRCLLARHAEVEQHLVVGRADLGALVADDRAVQAKLLRPGQSTGKRPAGGGGHCDTAALDALQRRHIARVQPQARVEDRAVEVEGQQPVTSYCRASGFRTFGGRPPWTAAAMLRPAIADISERGRVVALAMCGASTTLCSAMRPGWIAGSRSKTSRPAPAMRWVFSASTSAASSTTGPREVLIRMADCFIWLSCAVLMRWWVSFVSGTWIEMKSDSASSVGRSTPVAASSFSISGWSGC